MLFHAQLLWNASERWWLQTRASCDNDALAVLDSTQFLHYTKRIAGKKK